MPRLFKRAAARRDLVEHAAYLATEGGEELAERFLSQAEGIAIEIPEMRHSRRAVT